MDLKLPIQIQNVSLEEMIWSLMQHMSSVRLNQQDLVMLKQLLSERTTLVFNVRTLHQEELMKLLLLLFHSLEISLTSKILWDSDITKTL